MTPKENVFFIVESHPGSSQIEPNYPSGIQNILQNTVLHRRDFLSWTLHGNVNTLRYRKRCILTCWILLIMGTSCVFKLKYIIIIWGLGRVGKQKSNTQVNWQKLPWVNNNCDDVFPHGASGRESICQYKRDGFDSWVRKMLWSRKWQPAPIFLPGKSQGQRSLVGCSPWVYSPGRLQSRESRHDWAT